jgi:hypothetical protein
MWAAGVILLCIMSRSYPFFRAPDDITALVKTTFSPKVEDFSPSVAKLCGAVVANNTRRLGYWLVSGLPDGIFSKQKSHFGLIFEGLAVEDVGIFYGHLVFLRPIGRYVSWPFKNICCHLDFFPILVCCAKKNLATLAGIHTNSDFCYWKWCSAPGIVAKSLIRLTHCFNL